MADANEEPTTDSAGRRAQFRLRNMLTTAVGLVDRAANEQTFLVVKAKDGVPPMKKDDENEGGLRLPASAKQSLIDGVASTLEKLSAIAQRLQDCEVDESAECPPELAMQIDEIADDLDELADEFMPEASPEQMKSAAEKRATAKAAKEVAGAFERGEDGVLKGKPFPGAAPPFGAKDKDEAVDKGGSPFPGSPAEVDRNPPGEGAGSATAPAQNGPGDTDNPDVMLKSGRKMAKERLALLQKGHGLHDAVGAKLAEAVACHKEAHGCIGQVLKEVGDPAFMQPPGAAPKSPPSSAKPPAAEPKVTPRAAAPDMTGMAKAAVAEAMAGSMAALSSTLAELKAVQKSIGDAAALETLRGLTGRPRSQPHDGPPPAAPKPRQAWPSDMSADVKARRPTASK